MGSVMEDIYNNGVDNQTNGKVDGRKIFYVNVNDGVAMQMVSARNELNENPSNFSKEEILNIKNYWDNQKYEIIPTLQPMFENIWKWNDIAGVESNHQTMKLYEKLITEEYNEFMEAFTGNAALNFEAEVLEAEELDACIDLIWVIVGYMRSRGWTKETVREAIEEVERSNYSKFVEGADGTLECIKRADGKIQKPKEFSPANMLTIIEKFHKNLK